MDKRFMIGSVVTMAVMLSALVLTGVVMADTPEPEAGSDSTVGTCPCGADAPCGGTCGAGCGGAGGCPYANGEAGQQQRLRDGSCGCGADAPCGGNCGGGCGRGGCGGDCPYA